MEAPLPRPMLSSPGTLNMAFAGAWHVEAFRQLDCQARCRVNLMEAMRRGPLPATAVMPSAIGKGSQPGARHDIEGRVGGRCSRSGKFGDRHNTNSSPVRPHAALADRSAGGRNFPRSPRCQPQLQTQFLHRRRRAAKTWRCLQASPQARSESAPSAPGGGGKVSGRLAWDSGTVKTHMTKAEWKAACVRHHAGVSQRCSPDRLWCGTATTEEGRGGPRRASLTRTTDRHRRERSTLSGLARKNLRVG